MNKKVVIAICSAVSALLGAFVIVAVRKHKNSEY